MLVTLISLLYLVLDCGKAALRISGNNPSDVEVSILHETILGKVELHALPGGDKPLQLNVNDNESLVILARLEGILIGSAVLNIDTGQAEMAGAIAMPSAVSGVIISQDEFGCAPCNNEEQSQSDLQVVAEELNETLRKVEAAR